VKAGEKSKRGYLRRRKPLSILGGLVLVYLGITTYASNNMIGFLVGLLGIVIVIDGLGLLE